MSATKREEITRKHIGARVTLRKLRVVRSYPMMDHLMLIVLDVKPKGVLVTDRADRAFLINKKELMLL